jgi:hypothetical protein
VGGKVVHSQRWDVEQKEGTEGVGTAQFLEGITKNPGVHAASLGRATRPDDSTENRMQWSALRSLFGAARASDELCHDFIKTE